MNKSHLTLGPFETQPVENDLALCEIGATATDGHHDKYFGVIVLRGDAAIAFGQAQVRAMFEEFRDHDTMIERCRCGRTRARGFKNDAFWAGKPCEWCGGKDHAFAPRERKVNGREIHWQDAETVV